MRFACGASTSANEFLRGLGPRYSRAGTRRRVHRLLAAASTVATGLREHHFHQDDRVPGLDGEAPRTPSVPCRSSLINGIVMSDSIRSTVSAVQQRLKPSGQPHDQAVHDRGASSLPPGERPRHRYRGRPPLPIRPDLGAGAYGTAGAARPSAATTAGTAGPRRSTASGKNGAPWTGTSSSTPARMPLAAASSAKST